MFDFYNIIAVIVAVLSALATLYSGLIVKNKRREILETVKKETLDTVLESDDLKTLGDYLTNSLEKITISQYSSDKEVAKQVGQYLSKVKNFLGEKDKIVEELSKPQFKTEPPDLNKEIDIDRYFEPIIKELYNGQTWNALARLRRLIRRRFRNLLLGRGIEVTDRISASKLIDIFLIRFFVISTS